MFFFYFCIKWLNISCVIARKMGTTTGDEAQTKRTFDHLGLSSRTKKKTHHICNDTQKHSQLAREKRQIHKMNFDIFFEFVSNSFFVHYSTHTIRFGCMYDSLVLKMNNTLISQCACCTVYTNPNTTIIVLCTVGFDAVRICDDLLLITY